ncbi:hypothetical protein J437_LFUL013038 [Ladona fulva]|uniref:Transposase n=1 Tax=Ladona fulva TaxID=123851 RepID=A0A8K0KDX5_LADFU|nr:hypothetical protein J437_LFUL013038 [Ladona fulva]
MNKGLRTHILTKLFVAFDKRKVRVRNALLIAHLFVAAVRGCRQNMLLISELAFAETEITAHWV